MESDERSAGASSLSVLTNSGQESQAAFHGVGHEYVSMLYYRLIIV